MRHIYRQMSPQRRQSILDEARIAGRHGMECLPHVVHADDTSDSMIIAALDAHALGLAEREKEK